jgi:histidine triad (HIT) family protein
MISTCIFCEIIGGQHERSLVYEDDFSVAFMALEPVNQGHVLLMPKSHYEDMFIAPPSEIERLLPIANSIASALKHIYRPPKVGLVSASLVVQHAHWHITPIYDPSDITCRAELEGDLKVATRSELNTAAANIRASMRR